MNLERIISLKTRKQISRFVVAGVCAVGTDTAVYFMLINNFLSVLGFNWSKLISFLSGTLGAFVINKFWTFESKKRSFMEFPSFIFLGQKYWVFRGDAL